MSRERALWNAPSVRGVLGAVSHPLLRRVLLALFALGASLAVYVSFIEPARLVATRQELSLPNWPAQLAGLRVAFMSDLHVGSPHWQVEQLRTLVQRVNDEQPDLIVLGGDYISDVYFGTYVPAEPIAAELGRLRAPLGVFAVLGNHDWWDDGPRLRAAFEARGIVVLDDEARRVEARGTSFCLLGLRDEYERHLTARRELDLALPGLPLLVVVHEPDIFADMDERPSLVLAGHTHGGQVDIPLLGPRVVPSRYGTRFAAGHVVENGRHLFVTSGVGTSMLPVRFRVPPEYVILTLRGDRI